MEHASGKPSISSFRNLDVYQSSYALMLTVMKEVVPMLPPRERYDLCDQLSRSCKATPRLIAEGYGKRHQRAGFQKYIDDAIAECNETIVSLEQCRDLYSVDRALIERLVDGYDKVGRQLFRLSTAWSGFKHRTPSP
ncbi:MAG: four helix bundle protein [bacterium]|nr:four helix bundle protein [bacterium]